MYDPTVFYVRPSGSDFNSGQTESQAWLSLPRAMEAAEGIRSPVVIDVTGVAVDDGATFSLGARDLGPINFHQDPTAAVPDNFISQRHRQIRSSLQVVTTVRHVAEAFAEKSHLTTITVAETLQPDSLIGLRVVGSQPGVYGVVRANGTNTLEVTNTTGLGPRDDGLLWLCRPGASLTFGDAGDPQTQALYLQALCDWSLHGLSIRSHGKATSLCIYGSMPVDLRLCDIEGLQLAGQAPVTMDGCLITKGALIHDNGAVIGQQSLYRELDFVCHGASGITQFFGCAFDANRRAYGGGGGPSAAYSYRVENCGARGNASYAFIVAGGRTAIRSTVCEGNGAGGDILVQDGARLVHDDTVGTIVVS